MKLYLHVGTEKTGSSFLQKLAGTHRDTLARKGVLFPKAGRDESRLLHGTISPGNARELGNLIVDNQWQLATNWLADRVAMAKRIGCSQLFLSHELLFVALSVDGQLKSLEAAARHAGIDEIELFLMVRDPADHALSLYKHRAKNGTVEDVGVWLKRQYTTPDDLSRFLQQADASSSQLHLRKYSKDSDEISRKLFDEWLGVELPTAASTELVNPSLTLSEIQVIKMLASTWPDAVPLVYEKLVAIPRPQKASDCGMESQANAMIANHLCNLRPIFEDLCRRLESDGGITIPAYQDTSETAKEEFSFSQEQVAAWVSGMADARSNRYRATAWTKRIIREMLSMVRRQIASRRP